MACTGRKRLDTVRCTRCGERKDLSFFTIQPSGVYYPRCKPCKDEAKEEARKRAEARKQLSATRKAERSKIEEAIAAYEKELEAMMVDTSFSSNERKFLERKKALALKLENDKIEAERLASGKWAYVRGPFNSLILKKIK